MAVTKEIINSYENYGRCVKISNGTVEAYVTIDVGPRVIRYAFVGGENVLFNDIARRSKRMGPDYDNYYYKGAAWYLYGGHRLWITPESAPETYYPDNEEVICNQIGQNLWVMGEPLQLASEVRASLVGLRS